MSVMDCPDPTGRASNVRLSSPDHAESVRQIDLALRRNPKAAYLHNCRGRILYDLGRFEDAHQLRLGHLTWHAPNDAKPDERRPARRGRSTMFIVQQVDSRALRCLRKTKRCCLGLVFLQAYVLLPPPSHTVAGQTLAGVENPKIVPDVFARNVA